MKNSDEGIIGSVAMGVTIIVTASVVSIIAGLLIGCSEKKSAEQKITEQTSEKVHALTPEERQRAQINAKSYFEKEWAFADGKRGQLNECRPSDSNFNGLVTCVGFVPEQGGTFKEQKRYCGYTPTLVGCSDEDTVK